jgi:homoserine kinase
MSEDPNEKAAWEVSRKTAPVPGPITLRLPATSANLGPGFDTAGLAMELYLTIEATAVTEPGAPLLSLSASGRNADRCGRPGNNLIFETYRDVLRRAGRTILPLELRIHNEIPLGMGCGSSAAALLGGVLLANHFGKLEWDLQRCMEDACAREGHPDNVAACALGHMTAVSNGRVLAATCGKGLPWKLLVALPEASLATERARALLPAMYSRADAVHNVQRTALLVAAFTQGRGDLLQVAMQDTIHQPYRGEVCPLLPKLLPLAGQAGILGVALSGAGPAVLLIVDPEAAIDEVRQLIRAAAGTPELEILDTCIAGGVTQSS